VLAGQLDIIIDQASAALSIAAQRWRTPLRRNCGDAARFGAEIPTVDEAGLPASTCRSGKDVRAKGTPKEIIGKINAASVEALADPVVRRG